jgi:hypothetical protein
MFEAAGAAEAARGVITDAFIDILVAHGDAEACRQMLRSFAHDSRAAELIVSPMSPSVAQKFDTALACIEIIASLG